MRIREADTAMYYAKTSGRGQFRIFTPEMQTEASLRLQLESDLRQAVKAVSFILSISRLCVLSNGQVEGLKHSAAGNHPPR